MKKAVGDDGIKIIQYLKPSLLPILHNYLNITLHKGYHTINWKQIKAILLNKPGKLKSNPINYRTISLIHNLSKIMEKLLTIRITKWAEENKKLNKEQAGFRAFRSTFDKIFELTQTTMHAKNVKHYSAAVFMDVEKAFDKVWHDGLIHKLIEMGMPALYVRYISSFLKDRSFYVIVEGLKSKRIKLNFGVPQGSALSAILFILYVAGIPIPTTKQTYLSQFADDIKLYGWGKGFKTIQRNLQKSLDEIIIFCGKLRI